LTFVSQRQALQVAIGIIVASGALLLRYSTYTGQLWLCTFLLILIFTLSPLLAKPEALDDESINNEKLNAVRASSISTVANRISLTASPDLKASAASLPRNEIYVSQGALTELTPDQLDALIAHEDAHLRYKHIELLVLFRSLWVTLGAIVLTSTYAQWALEPLVFAGVWLVSDLLLAKAWLRIAEFHADQVAGSRTSVQCYATVLETISSPTTQERTLLGDLNATHPSYAKRRSQLQAGDQKH
jgi:Zn-dependent protease with chaperone function